MPAPSDAAPDRAGPDRAGPDLAGPDLAGPDAALVVAPGVEQLALRTPTLPPATHTNSFLVGTREAVLVEPASSFPEEIERVVAWVHARQAAGLTVRAILLTHHHVDHAGGARDLSRRLELPIWAHAATAQRLEGHVAIDRLLDHGEQIALDGPTKVTIEAVHTPGHAPGHLCFLMREANVMIAGDMVAGVGTILVEPTDGDMQLYLQSLAQMDELDTRVLLPAHGDPITDPRTRLRFYIQHRLNREAKISAALAELSRVQPAQIHDLVAVAYADTPPIAWPLARLSAEAHLIKLVREGKAEQSHAGYRSLL